MKRLLTFCALFILLTSYAPAQTVLDWVSFEWIAPTQNVDDTLLVDLAGYRLYYGTIPGGPYGNNVQIPDPYATTYTIVPLAENTWYFVLTAYNSLGLESDYSNEASITIRGVISPPKPPAAFRALIK